MSHSFKAYRFGLQDFFLSQIVVVCIGETKWNLIILRYRFSKKKGRKDEPRDAENKREVGEKRGPSYVESEERDEKEKRREGRDGETGASRGEANKETKIERGEGMLDLGVSFAKTMAPSQSEARWNWEKEEE